jgi:hypothetical protein
MEKLMRHHLCAGIAALALIAVTGPAAAQNAASTQGQNQQSLNLDSGQQHQVTQGLSNQQAQAKPPGFDGQVGNKVPDTMHPQSLPGNVTSDVPETKGYLFVKLPDRALLIDPETKTVVELVLAENASGSTPDNTGGHPGQGGAQMQNPSAGQK